MCESHDLLMMTISPCAVAIVGFANDAVTVTEGEDFTECVAVTQPTPDFAMQLSFYLNVNFIPITAGVCVHVHVCVCNMCAGSVWGNIISMLTKVLAL